MNEDAFARFVSRLRVLADAVRHIPTGLYLILYLSILASLVLAYLWFWSSAFLLVKLIAIPWLVVTAVPQFGLWLLASTLSDFLSLPQRLWELKDDIRAHGRDLDRRIRKLEGSAQPEANLFRTLRNVISIRSELGRFIATRVIFQRFAGPLAAVMGPVSLVWCAAIILIATIYSLLVLL